MLIDRLWVSFFQWFPYTGIVAGTSPVKPEFSFLKDYSSGYPPPQLPVIGGLGNLTALGLHELRGLRGHEGTEKVWSCLDPYLPVQVVPELGLRINRQDTEFSNVGLWVYLHPFGWTAGLRFRLSARQPLDGFRLARILNNLERKKMITARAHGFQRARNVIDVFARLRDAIAEKVFVKPPQPSLAEAPFCVLTLDNDTDVDLKTLAGSDSQKLELISATERHTGNENRPSQDLASLCFVEEGRTARVNVPTGWIFGSKNGVAIISGQDRNRNTHRAPGYAITGM